MSICIRNLVEIRPRNGWDTPVYIFPRWRPSAILELSFLHFGSPTTSLLVGYIFTAGGVLIRSNLDFKNLLIWQENFYSRPFLCGFGDFGPPRSSQISLRLSKSTNGCENTSFELSSVKIASTVWPIALVKKGIQCTSIKNSHRTRFITHAQSRNGWNYSYEILHTESLAGYSDIFETAWKLVQWFGRGGVQIFAFLVDFSIGF